jgi:hypothetical protein
MVRYLAAEMLNTPSRRRVIDISVAGLMTSVQEVILSFRHGEKDEDLVNHRAERADLYRLLEVNLQPNEQRRATVVFQYKGLVFRLVPKRYFEHQGSLYRFIYLKKIFAEARPDGPLGSEMNGLQIAGWVCRKYYRSGPKALWIAYIEVGVEDSGPVIGGKKLIEFEPISDHLAEELLKAQLDPIVTDFDTADEALPKCSLPERYGTIYNPWRKCRDFCRARHVCAQYAQARKQIEDLTIQVESDAPLF